MVFNYRIRAAIFNLMIYNDLYVPAVVVNPMVYNDLYIPSCGIAQL